MKKWIWMFLAVLIHVEGGEMGYVRDRVTPPDFSSVPACSGKVIGGDSPFVKHVQESIRLASEEEGKLSAGVLGIDGMTSAKGRFLLNHICSLENTVYFEVGSWKGSSFVSALYGNQGIRQGYAVEKWVRYADNGFDFGNVRDEFFGNVDSFLKGLPLKVYEQDCFSLDLEEVSEKVTVYFYDGEHREWDQKQAFLYFDGILADEFIAVVDDWNWESTRRGTFEAFEELGYEVLFEQYLPANFDGDLENWWNGIYVAVIRKGPV
ncbi:MAG: hypothetical protein JSS32_02250 [Verrucomicrobia bacterium]|nr:hypothetical protein [Verrucomicrobiota bacterium]